MNARLTMDERDELNRLRLLTEEQAEEIRAWEEYERGDGAAISRVLIAELGLAKSPALILAELVRNAGDPISNERLLDASAAGRMDVNHEPDKEIIKVHICRIRSVLKRNGLVDAIQCHYGFGYSITRDAAKRLCPDSLGPEVDPEVLNAARLVVEKHQAGRLQPAHVDELRRALEQIQASGVAA